MNRPPVTISGRTLGLPQDAAAEFTPVATRTAARVATLLLVTGFVVLFAMSALSASPLVYDEPWYLGSVELIHRYGLSVRFLAELPGPAGPLYTVVHAFFEPVTHLRPPLVRYVNLGFLAITAVILEQILRLLEVARPRLGALSLIAVPMTWPMAGLALTEFPAVCCAVVAVWLLLLGLQWLPVRLWPGLALCGFGGLAFATAVSGRQPLLVLLGGLPFLLTRHVRRWIALVVFAAFPLLTIAALFRVWGGIVPRKTAVTAGAVSVTHGTLAFFYAGLVVLVIAPRFFVRSRRIVVGLLAINIALLFFGVDFGITPLRAAALRVLPAPAFAAYAALINATALFVGALFVVSALVRMWERREQRSYLFLTTGALLCLLSVALISHQFSSRYVGTAAPFLIAAVAPTIKVDWAFAALTGIGVLVGFVSLASYLHPFA